MLELKRSIYPNNTFENHMRAFKEKEINVTKNPDCIMNKHGRHNKGMEKFYTFNFINESFKVCEPCVNSSQCGFDRLKILPSEKPMTDLNKDIFCECALFDHKLADYIQDKDNQRTTEHRDCVLKGICKYLDYHEYYIYTDKHKHEDKPIKLCFFCKDVCYGVREKTEGKKFELIQTEDKSMIECECDKHSILGLRIKFLINNVLNFGGEKQSNQPIIIKKFSPILLMNSLVHQKQLNAEFIEPIKKKKQDLIEQMRKSKAHHLWEESIFKDQAYFCLKLLEKLYKTEEIKHLGNNCHRANDKLSIESFSELFDYNFLTKIFDTEILAHDQIIAYKTYFLKNYIRFIIESKFKKNYMLNHSCNQSPFMRMLYIPCLNYFFRKTELDEKKLLDLLDKIAKTITDYFHVLYLTEVDEDKQNYEENISYHFKLIYAYFNLVLSVSYFRIETGENMKFMNSVVNKTLQLIKNIRANIKEEFLQDLLNRIRSIIEKLMKKIYFNVCDYAYVRKYVGYKDKEAHEKLKWLVYPHEDVSIGKNIIKILFCFRISIFDIKDEKEFKSREKDDNLQFFNQNSFRRGSSENLSGFFEFAQDNIIQSQRNERVLEFYEKLPPNDFEFYDLLFHSNDMYGESIKGLYKYLLQVPSSSDMLLGIIDFDYRNNFYEILNFNQAEEDQTQLNPKMKYQNSVYYKIFSPEDYLRINELKVNLNNNLKRMILKSDMFCVSAHSIVQDIKKEFLSVLYKNYDILKSHKPDDSILNGNGHNGKLINNLNDHQYKVPSENDHMTIFLKKARQFVLVKAGILQKLFSILKNFYLHSKLYDISHKDVYKTLNIFLEIFSHFISDNPLVSTFFLDVEVLSFILTGNCAYFCLIFYQDIINTIYNNNYRINPLNIIKVIKGKMPLIIGDKQIRKIAFILKFLNRCLKTATKKSIDHCSAEISEIISFLFEEKFFHELLSECIKMLKNNEETGKYIKILSGDIREKFIEDQILIEESRLEETLIECYALGNKHLDQETNGVSKLNGNGIINDSNTQDENKRAYFDFYLEKESNAKNTNEEKLLLLKSFISLINCLAPDIQLQTFVKMEEYSSDNTECFEGEEDEIKEDFILERTADKLYFDFRYLSALIKFTNIPPVFKTKLFILFNKYTLKFPFIEKNINYNYLRVYSDKVPEIPFDSVFMNKDILFMQNFNYHYIIDKECPLYFEHLRNFPIYIEKFKASFLSDPKILYDYFNVAVVKFVYNVIYKISFFQPQSICNKTLLNLKYILIQISHLFLLNCKNLFITIEQNQSLRVFKIMEKYFFDQKLNNFELGKEIIAINQDLELLESNAVKSFDGSIIDFLKKYFEKFKFQKKYYLDSVTFLDNIFDRDKPVESLVVKFPTLVALRQATEDYIKNKADLKNSNFHPLFNDKLALYEEYKENIFIKSYSLLVTACKERKSLCLIRSRLRIFNRLFNQDPRFCQIKLLEVCSGLKEDVLGFMTKELMPYLFYILLVEYSDYDLNINPSQYIFSTYSLLESILVLIKQLCYDSNQVFQTYFMKDYMNFANIETSQIERREYFWKLMFKMNESILYYLQNIISKRNRLIHFRPLLGNEKYWNIILDSFKELRIEIIQSGLNLNTKDMLLSTEMVDLTKKHNSYLNQVYGYDDCLPILSQFFQWINGIVEEYADNFGVVIKNSIINNINTFNVGEVIVYCVKKLYKIYISKTNSKLDNNSVGAKRDLDNIDIVENGRFELIEYYKCNKKFSKDPYMTLASNCYIFLKLCDTTFGIEKAKNVLKSFEYTPTISDRKNLSSKEFNKNIENNEVITFMHSIVFHIELNLLTEAKNHSIWKNPIINSNLYELLPDDALKREDIKKLSGKEPQEKEEYFLTKVYFQSHPDTLNIGTETLDYIAENTNDDYNSRLRFLLINMYHFEDDINMSKYLRNKSIWILRMYKIIFRYDIVQAISVLMILTVNFLMMWNTFHTRELIIMNVEADQAINLIGAINLAYLFVMILNFFLFNFLRYIVIYIKRSSVHHHHGTLTHQLWERYKDLLFLILDLRVLPLIWNFFWGLIAISNPKHSYLYSLQLFSIFNLDSTMRIAIYSVFLRASQFAFSGILTFMLLLFYAGVSFYFIREIWEKDVENICQSYVQCFFTMALNIKFGGGVGDIESLGMVAYSDTHYWARLFYDWSYFFLIILLMLNIINGIVVDTFQDLRQKENEHLEILTSHCFICDVDKTTFEINGLNYYSHINHDHNVINYLHYILKINITDQEDLTSTEYMIKKQINSNQINFFPLNHSLSLYLKSRKEYD